MKLKRRSLKRGRVEIIPMIDTILILLIFYMSFSTFSEKEKAIDSNLPLVSAKNATAPTEQVIDLAIHVRDIDHILVNGAEFSSETMRHQMDDLSALGQKTTILIDAEPETSYQAVIAALDACASAHLTNVAFRPLAEKAAAKPAAEK